MGDSAVQPEYFISKNSITYCNYSIIQVIQCLILSLMILYPPSERFSMVFKSGKRADHGSHLIEFSDIHVFL